MQERPFPINNYAEYRPAKNPYAVKYLSLPATPPTAFTCHATEAHRGRWRELFGAGPDVKLNLEIGCYHGESLVAMAEANPDELFLGIEWKFREAYRAAEKAIVRKLKNLVILRGNAARLPWIVAPGEVDRVWIAFPDPWPKAGQQKWRLLQSEFFYSLALLLKDGDPLLIKTDDLDYSRFIATELAEANAFSPIAIEEADQIWVMQPTTPFEKIFLRNGSPIFRWALRRNRNLVEPPAPVQPVFASLAH